jgi:hypothetical protein
MITLGSWFHLRSGRRSFKPDPLQDQSVMFCHQKVQEGIQLAVERAFATGESPKLLLWGDWGVGKTHTLRHLDYWLGTHEEDFPTMRVFADFGDVSKSSRFEVVHRDLLDGIGLDQAIRMAHLYIERNGALLGGLEAIGVPPGIGQAFNKLLVATPGQAPPDVVVTAWNYLRGANVGRAGTALGLQDQIVDSKDFYHTLAALGHVVEKVTGKKLLFLVDEASRLEAVGDALEVERHWINVNTLIFDQENRHFGFMYTVSGKSSDEIPRALFETQIENRLGNRRIELLNLLPDDVRQFVRGLVESFVDRSAVEAEDDAALCKDQAYSWDTYPFTKEAFDVFIEYFQRTPENSKPRNIAEKLDEAAFYALKGQQRLISEQVLEKVGI